MPVFYVFMTVSVSVSVFSEQPVIRLALTFQCRIYKQTPHMKTGNEGSLSCIK